MKKIHFELHTHVLVPIHWGVEVEVANVDGHEFRPWGGDNAVKQEFDGQELGGWRSAIEWAISSVPPPS